MPKYNMYTVVLRCGDAHFRVPQGRGVLIRPIASEFGDFELRLVTRTDELEKFETPIPRELWIEVTGPAPTLEKAVNIASGTANDYVRQVAFGANAWQGTLNVHLAYDSSAGHKRREFFQNWGSDEVGLPRVARDIDADLMFRLLIGISQIEERDRSRILRAIMQYTDALQYWKRGNDLYALAHIYMGVEAMTPIALKAELKRRGLKKRSELEEVVAGPSDAPWYLQLATRLYEKAGGYRPSKIDPWIRRQIIFRGDSDTYKLAKKASDHLEHGLSHHNEVQMMAAECVEKTAELLRHSILDHIPISEEDRQALKDKPYVNPVKTGGFERQLLATIVSEEDDIAAEDQAYPIVQWSFELQEFAMTDDGGYRMKVNQKMTPKIGEKARMELDRVYLAGPTETTHSEPEIKIDKKEQSRSEAGVSLSVNDPEDGKWLLPLGRFLLNCNATRRLSIFWVQKLDKETRGEIFSFSENVEKIAEIVAREEVPKELRQKCNEAWEEAIQLDKVRQVLAGAATVPDGLVCFEDEPTDKSRLMNDINKLKDLNNQAVQLARTVTELLDELIQLPNFSE